MLELERYLSGRALDMRWHAQPLLLAGRAQRADQSSGDAHERNQMSIQKEAIAVSVLGRRL